MAERIGSVCTINGKDAYTQFNADLKELTPVAGSITADFSKALGASSLQIINHKFETGGINVVFYVGGATKQECYINTSNLIAECKDCIIKTDEDEFEYVAVLTAYNVVETGVEYFNEVTLTLSAIKRLSEKRYVYTSATLSSSNGKREFENVGSVTSGLSIRIITKGAVDTMLVNGITVRNLPANSILTINGINGTIDRSGINWFLNTDLIEFPKVVPGVNTLNVEVSDYSKLDRVSINFYPTFIV